MSISFPSADFAPTLSGYTGQGPFRFWCQKVLPIVYDDSLSYYELLCKVVNYLNNVIADVATVEENVGEIVGSFNSLQEYVNDHMAELVTAFNELELFVDTYFQNLDVQQEINNKLNTMASDGSLTELIAPLVGLTAPSIITNWLENNITPTSPPIDRSLTVASAGADAQVTGVAFSVNNDFRYPAMEQGNVTLQGEEESNNFIRTVDRLFIPGKTIVKFKVPDGYNYTYYTYNTADQATANATFLNRDFLCAGDRYIRIKVSREPIGEITPTDASVVVSLNKVEDEIYEKEPEEELVYNHSNGHVEKINMTESYGLTYTYSSGAVVPNSITRASKFIKCKASDLFNFVFKATGTVSVGNAYVNIYIYNENLELQTDYIFTSTTDNNINRMFDNTLQQLCGNQISGIPAGYYIQFCNVKGLVDVYKWDGTRFGSPALAQTCGYDKTTNTVYNLLPDGGSGVILPENYRYIMAKPGYTFYTMAVLTTSGVSNYDKIGSSALCPTQIIWCSRRPERKIVTIVKGYDYSTGTYEKVVQTGFIGAYVSVLTFDNYSVNTVQGYAENLNRTITDYLMAVKWTPTNRDLYAANYNDKSFYGVFRKGVEYNGIPYGSRWLQANYIGWHVSVHTFVNAANDPLSVFNTIGGNGSHEGLYYSLVCTAFTGILGRFPYPLSNFALMHHPYVGTQLEFTPNPGNIYTNGYGHCVVGVGNECNDEGVLTTTFVEANSPLMNYTQHYKSITSNLDPTRLSFYGYANKFIYRVWPLIFNETFYNMTDRTLTLGGARPNRGDKSVYTSDMDIVANIYDENASYVIVRGFKMSGTSLVYDEDIGEVERIPINHNAQVIIPKNNLVTGKIYGICTDTNAENEFFEYYETVEVNYSITNDGTLIVEDNPEFWYCICTANAEGGPVYTIGYESSGDYSIYQKYMPIQERPGVDAPIKFFKRGVFGAYVMNP